MWICVLCYGEHFEIFASKALWGAGDILCIFRSIAGNINEQALLLLHDVAKLYVCQFCILIDWLFCWLWSTANTFPHIPSYGPTAVNEMLSITACLRGLSLVHESNGDLHTYREAMKELLSSVRCCLQSLHVLTNALGSYKLKNQKHSD